MSRTSKQNQVFRQLVDRQLLPFGKTYEDVKSDSTWYLRYKTTPKAEREFINWGVQFLKSELGVSTKVAENEMSWFVLQWGLTTDQAIGIQQLDDMPTEAEQKVK